MSAQSESEVIPVAPAHNSSTGGMPTGSLSLWDMVSLIIGIVVGVSIFKVPGTIFALCGEPWIAFTMWGLGAFVALCGALCFAELAAAWPRFGAEYVFLDEAFHPRLSCLFAFLTIFIVLPGNIGAAGFVLANYSETLFPALQKIPALTAGAAIIGLTVVQLCGLTVGRLAQNTLTLLKLTALSAVLICGFILPASEPTVAATATLLSPSSEWPWAQWGLALVFVCYAFGGWNDAVTVTPEVRDCRKNLPRALFIGIGLIFLLYIALNYAFLRVLGYDGLVNSAAPSADLIQRALGNGFSQAMSVMIIVSALGAMNGMMFTGCRLLSAVGQDYQFFSAWGRWNKKQVPVFALLTIAGLSLFLTVLLGEVNVRSTIDRLVTSLSLTPPNWEFYGGGFDVLVAASAPIFWTFFLLCGFGLIVLRFTASEVHRPFRCPLHPLPAIVFIAFGSYMCWSSLVYAGNVTLLMSPFIFLAIAAAFVLQKRSPDQPTAEDGETVVSVGDLSNPNRL